MRFSWASIAVSIIGACVCGLWLMANKGTMGVLLPLVLMVAIPLLGGGALAALATYRCERPVVWLWVAWVLSLLPLMGLLLTA